MLGFIDWIENPGYGVLDMAGLFAQQLSIGLAVGLAAGFAGAELLKRSRLATGGLYPVATLAIAAIAFGGADVMHGSGFLAVYLAGLVLGSREIPARRTVFAFHEGLAWVAQVAMFFTLGLLVFPSQLGDVAPEATIVAFVSVAIARPLATFIATAFEHYSAREKVVLGWAGLRGAVPVVLATFPVIEEVPRSQEFFNIAFFAVLLSTVLQGATIEPLARALGLTTSEPALPRPLADSGTAQGLGAEVVEYPVASHDAIVGLHIRDLGLPRDALVNVIVRGGRAIPPRGSTKLVGGDVLHILVRSGGGAADLPAARSLADRTDPPGDRRRRGGLDDDARVPRTPARSGGRLSQAARRRSCSSRRSWASGCGSSGRAAAGSRGGCRGGRR